MTVRVCGRAHVLGMGFFQTTDLHTNSLSKFTEGRREGIKEWTEEEAGKCVECGTERVCFEVLFVLLRCCGGEGGVNVRRAEDLIT